jgi:LysR family glycine cleavage system transcriptional activator
MFDAAARHLNFRLAAEELNLTQGAVAQQVRRLESDLGLQLFRRKARGLALTQIGREYHGPVRRAFTLIDDATEKLRPRNRRVTLSVTPSFASKWLVSRLGNFAAAHPDIDLQTVASEELAEFRSDGVEIAIRQGRPPFGDGLRVELLAPLNLCAVCSPDYAANASPIHRFEDFAAHPLIQDAHSHWDALLESAGLKAEHRIMQFNQTALAMDAAANGQGVALAPRLLLSAEFAQGKLVELWQDARADQRGFYVVCPISPGTNPARDRVIEWILSEAGRSADPRDPTHG